MSPPVCSLGPTGDAQARLRRFLPRQELSVDWGKLVRLTHPESSQTLLFFSYSLILSFALGLIGEILKEHCSCRIWMKYNAVHERDAARVELQLK